MVLRTAEDIICDREKGANQLAQDAVESVLHMPEDIDGYLEKLVKGRPTMAPLINLANHIYLSMEEGKDVIQEAEEFRKRLVHSRVEAAKNMYGIIKGKQVLTLSYSSTVKASLERLSRVSILESRPLMEGRKLASELRTSGVDVELWTDAAMKRALQEVDAVVVGADAFTTTHFVNKIGTAPLALCSDELGTPFFVVSDTTKLLPKGVSLTHHEEHPASEVWKGADGGISVRNPYFESVPLDNVLLVTERGTENVEPPELAVELEGLLLKE